MNEKGIFISYGHNFFDGAIRRLTDDLRAAGYDVFLDTDYLKLGDWEKIIEEHIDGSKYFLFMISARSVSRDGYCLNELSRAGESNSTIIPIKLDDSYAPLSINKYQRLMLQECLTPDGGIDEVKYSAFLDNLIKILNGEIQLGFSTEDIMLRSTLRPMSSKEDLFKHYSLFCGRRSAFEDFEKFLKSDKHYMWVPASPGSGKTAFASMLSWRYSEYVKAIHFCKFNNSDRINAKSIITSLAYHMSSAFPEYRARLVSLVSIDNLLEKNADRLFEYLFIEPVSTFIMEKPVVLVIDALDECSFRGRNELADLLMRYRTSLPTWLKIVITSRDEVEIRRIFLNINEYICHSFEKDNYADLKEYYLLQFPDIQPDKLETLLQKSEGSFLYACEICKQIKSDSLSLEDINFFPIGIYGFYNDCFGRIFEGRSDTNEGALTFDLARPVLELLCIINEPVEINFYSTVIEEYDDYTVRRILAALVSLFPIREGFVEPLHKSLIDWLTNDKEISHKYYINKIPAYRRMYDYYHKLYVGKNYLRDKAMIKNYGFTMIKLEKFDELYSLLDDAEFQNAKIKVLQFDSGLELYINELAVLYQDSPEKCMALFESATFIGIFSEYRRLLYNSGMFHKLKNLGLSIALKQNASDWGLEGEVGKIMYYYIVENFHTAINKIKQLLRTHPEIKTKYGMLAEIYNTKGLSERKLVLFDDAIESLDLAIENGETALDEPPDGVTDPEFEISLAHLIKGKIYLHELKFPAANKSFKTAIRVLSNKIDEMPDCDKKISNTLFLAEDYRVYADACIWEDNPESADDNLQNCEEIYSGNRNSIDRYYVRYRYTSVFNRIMHGDGFNAEEELNELLKKLGGGKYDTGQINFLLALNAYVHHGDDIKKLEKARDCAEKGADIYFNIEAPMEEAECRALSALISKKLGKRAEVDDPDNEFIDMWIDYITPLIKAKAGEQDA